MIAQANCSDGQPAEQLRVPSSKPILIVGLGNSLLGDDAVGMHVIAQVSNLLDGEPAVECVFSEEMGLSLLDWICGREVVIIVDAIISGKIEPGQWLELEPEDLISSQIRRPHSIGIKEALDLGRQLGLPMPKKVFIFAVEVVDPYSIGAGLTAEVERAVPLVSSRIVEFLKGLRQNLD